jgi:ATP-dependent DNA ligase
MSLPLSPPVLPQLARPRAKLPDGDGWAYEPKWDGFRAIAFADRGELHLQSRNGKPLTRYFPELAFAPGLRAVLDGEIIIQGPDGRQLFDALGQRIHPAASRVEMLSKETPATFIAFDLLAHDDVTLLALPYDERRRALEDLHASLEEPTFELTPVVATAEEAETWLQDAEGVIAKERAAHYKPGERTGMVKVKRVRTIDAVVLGWRPGKAEGTVGSLILGLYDEDGQLHGVGHTSGFKAAEKKALVEKLRPYETGERGHGDPSRWASDRELEWIALRPELVVEVTFDHVSDGRIRHGTKVQRWREDREPRSCLLSQLDQ